MISLNGNANSGNIEAWHEKDKIFDKKAADEVHNKVKDEKKGKVESIDRKKSQQAPPHPFDLTSLQIEAHKCIHISPKATLEIAQELYTGGYISYPRTSSQQLPESINYQKILKGLSKSKNFKEGADFLLKKKQLKPNNGKKTDPAHPAIYPTGIVPKLADQRGKVYELIVRRFLATFGEPATRESVNAKIAVNGEIFIAKGITTVEKGWHTLLGFSHGPGSSWPGRRTGLF